VRFPLVMPDGAEYIPFEKAEVEGSVGARFRKLLPQVPIIYTSGTVVATKLADARSLFFPKPYEPGAIVKACRTFLQHWADATKAR
jgi:hypothetical protein